MKIVYFYSLCSGQFFCKSFGPISNAFQVASSWLTLVKFGGWLLGNMCLFWYVGPRCEKLAKRPHVFRASSAGAQHLDLKRIYCNDNRQSVWQIFLLSFWCSWRENHIEMRKFSSRIGEFYATWGEPTIILKQRDRIGLSIINHFQSFAHHFYE